MEGADLDAMVLLPPRPAWWAEAACRARPDVNFFPTQGELAAPAKAVCAECPVREACLAYATEHNIDHGIWGGMSARDRRLSRAGQPRRRSVGTMAGAHRWRRPERDIDAIAARTATWRRTALARGERTG